MNILLTGHKGFIGQNLMNSLDADGHNVFVYDWESPGFPSVEGLDWCLHVGAISSTAEKDVDKIMNQNYDFSRWLLLECNKHNVNFQFSSSASVYGLGENFNEEAPVNPQSPYAWSKYLFERFATKISVGWKIKIQMFRYFNVYGAGEDHKEQPSPYTVFERQAKETGTIKLFEGSENYLRDFVPIETIVSVHKKFFDVDKSGIWNVGTGRPTSFESVARMVAEKYNARVEYIPMPEHLKNQYQKYTCADLTKIRQEINL
jgi:ADP-L-glycero-D-manno-heptose 6-epimerase